jgi:hypothetical protein
MDRCTDDACSGDVVGKSVQPMMDALSLTLNRVRSEKQSGSLRYRIRNAKDTFLTNGML